MADTHGPQRRPSITPAALRIMKPVPTLPPEFAPKGNRTTLDVKILGGFIDYHPSLESQMRLDEHARKIERESIARIVAAQKAKGHVRLPAGEFEKHYTPNSMDSRARCRQHRPVHPSTAMFQSMDTYPDSAVCMEAVKIEFVKLSESAHKKGKTKHFRRLTLGGVSPELGILWDDDRFEMGGSDNG